MVIANDLRTIRMVLYRINMRGAGKAEMSMLIMLGLMGMSTAPVLMQLSDPTA
jgi:hypothetical protein